jgi:hypothetical protein
MDIQTKKCHQHQYTYWQRRIDGCHTSASTLYVLTMRLKTDMKVLENMFSEKEKRRS